MNTPHDEQQPSGKAGRRGNGRQPPREPIAITDRRRIDPVTGRVREDTPGSRSAHADEGTKPMLGEKAGAAPRGPGGTPAGRGPGADRPASRQTDADRPASRQTDADRLAELTADLQRLQAEYTNYRRRVERDRATVAENTKATVATAFLGVLDDLDWAREHGDTAREPLHSLYRKIRTILARMGVSAFGERGDRFDPTLHEAASHEGHGTDLVIDTVLRRGYTFGVHKVLRTALVTVIDRDRYENTSTAGDPPEDPPGTNTSPDPSSDTDARLESGGAGDPGADPNPYRCG